MTVLVTAIKEVYGLFVEDDHYALEILVWLLFAVTLVPHIASAPLRAPALLLGLLFILCENVLRNARTPS